MNKSLKLIGDKVLITEDKPESRSKSNLFITASSRKKINIGTVKLTSKSIGDDYSYGDRIVYLNHSGVEVSIDNEKHRVLERREIVLIEVSPERYKTVEGNILVKPNESIKRSASGLKRIKEEELEKTSGVVISSSASGDDYIKRGDTVVYSKFAGFPLNVKKENHVVLKYEEIFIIIEQDETE